MKKVLVRKIEKENLIFGRYVQDWCKLPYPNHPKGCPNYGKRKNCPPNVPLIDKIIAPPYILVAIKFNLKEHMKKMKKKHPKWTDKKLRCILYWQKKVDKILKEESKKIASSIVNSYIIYKPEAYGVNIFATVRKLGLRLEKNPEIVWKISIIGIKKQMQPHTKVGGL